MTTSIGAINTEKNLKNPFLLRLEQGKHKRFSQKQKICHLNVRGSMLRGGVVFRKPKIIFASVWRYMDD